MLSESFEEEGDALADLSHVGSLNLDTGKAKHVDGALLHADGTETHR